MQANEIVKEVLREKNINQGEFTELLGMKYQSGVSQALNRDMKISMLARFADVLNCEVVFRDKKTKNEWVIGQHTARSYDNHEEKTNESNTNIDDNLDTLLPGQEPAAPKQGARIKLV